MVSTQILIEFGSSVLLFIVAWQLISRVIVVPFLGYIEEREDRTTGADGRTRAFKEESRSLQETLERKRREARLEGISARDQLIQAAKEESQKILHEAEQRTQNELKKVKDEIYALRKRFETESSSELQKLTSLIHEKLTSGKSSQLIH